MAQHWGLEVVPVQRVPATWRSKTVGTAMMVEALRRAVRNVVSCISNGLVLV